VGAQALALLKSNPNGSSVPGLRPTSQQEETPIADGDSEAKGQEDPCQKPQ
jgi:hypothetical protein